MTAPFGFTGLIGGNLRGQRRRSHSPSADGDGRTLAAIQFAFPARDDQGGDRIADARAVSGDLAKEV